MHNKRLVTGLLAGIAAASVMGYHMPPMTAPVPPAIERRTPVEKDGLGRRKKRREAMRRRSLSVTEKNVKKFYRLAVLSTHSTNPDPRADCYLHSYARNARRQDKASRSAAELFASNA